MCPAQQGGHQFAAAVVGDVGHVGVGEMLHKLHVEKSLRRERAGAAEAVLVRGGLGFSIRSASEVMPDAGSTPQPMVNSEICAMGVKLS